MKLNNFSRVSQPYLILNLHISHTETSNLSLIFFLTTGPGSLRVKLGTDWFKNAFQKSSILQFLIIFIASNT